MSLFGCKDDTLLWFIILFILLFCTGNSKTADNCGCDDCCDMQRDCNRCLR